jgi:hypothetical protein
MSHVSLGEAERPLFFQSLWSSERTAAEMRDALFYWKVKLISTLFSDG